MRIGFEGKKAMLNFTGLGNYSRYVLEILSKYYPKNDYIVFAPKQKNNRRLNVLLTQYTCLKVLIERFHNFPFIKYLCHSYITKEELDKEQIQIFHGLTNELPINIKKTGVKSIVTIHDLIFLRCPTYYFVLKRKKYTQKVHQACNNADHIITVSQCTKKDIIRYFNISEDKITTIYQGCDESFTIPVSDKKKIEIRNKYELPEHYILNVGKMEKRKNVFLAVKAMRKISEDICLVIVGSKTTYTKKIEKYIIQNHIENRVLILNNVSILDLPAIYQQAELFIYPSIYEGFGIPIIEALNSGIPVIATADSCLEEAGGPSSIYVKSNDEIALVTAIKEVLSNPQKKKEMIYEGLEYAKRFSEKIQADLLITLYKKTLND